MILSAICKIPSYPQNGIVEWLTNDYTYHTVKMCMAGDDLWIIARMGSNLAITVGYAFFAWHNWIEFRKHKKTWYSYGFLSLALVFLFCGLSGYLLDFISYWIPMYRVATITRILDAVATWGLNYFVVTTPLLRKFYES
jgi:hypothetical protein